MGQLTPAHQRFRAVVRLSLMVNAAARAYLFAIGRKPDAVLEALSVTR